MSDARVILVVDDDDAVRDMLDIALSAAGFDVILAADAADAFALIYDRSPDLVLLDWMMPGTSGLEFLRRLRRGEQTRSLPVIMLTARTEEPSKVTGLDAGADDYVEKPFSRRELISRVNALLRRSVGDTPSEQFNVGVVGLDSASHRVFVEGQPVTLGPTEFRLLRFFMSNPDRVYSRDQILDHVWGHSAYLDERTVDVHIRRLRKAIAPVGERYVQTVRGVGYRFSTAETVG